MIVSITNELSLNPDMVMGMERDNRFYMNGSESYLVITMVDGTVHRIKHGFGVDIYAIEKKLSQPTVES